jgi:hypothetical protein
MQPSKEAQDHAKSKVEAYHIAAWESGVLEAKVRARQSAILRCAMTAQGQSRHSGRVLIISGLPRQADFSEPVRTSQKPTGDIPAKKMFLRM